MHLKRLAAPKVLKIPRKTYKFVPRPEPGRHPLEESIPLAVILRDILKLADTYAEAKKIIHLGRILVDGEVVTEPRFGVGLMDIVSIPSIDKSYRVLPRFERGLELLEISIDEAGIKPCQVKRKQHVNGGHIQFTLHDGRNIQFPPNSPEIQSIKVGDTFLVEIPSMVVRAVFKRVVGSYCLITSGSRMGLHGRLASIDVERAYPAKRHAVLESGVGKVTTILDYFMSIGEDKPWIALF
ncbi:MAG: 30S ribosomal protein S4e [Nitrososphaerota archaeon]|nr:30S ribosomal protein S4e [Candidatus Calditenuaceae archaeon]MDW8072945.1 30S ribosomal protein S4e [Nitrososphaerota archaeon]